MRPYRIIPMLLAATAGLAQAAHAADARVVTRRYEPSTIVTVPGRIGTQATIRFSDDERIENVAVGDSAVWQVTPNKRANLLFVKPTALRARTNMTVVTDQRTYLFDLVAGGAATPLYVLSFSYPAPPRPIAPVVVAAASAPERRPEPDPASLNFGWKAQGSQQLIPTRVFDDGRAVYLGWRSDVAMPAILVRDEKGVEGPVNHTLKGDYVVVDGVPGQLVLRWGKEMATLTPEPRQPVRTAANQTSERSLAR
ncbi:TrbG/VirB9 family P-type conjugative transfer protein [uncultured Sphingomonas sp.]|uniref:TrbG/VirB9 family P-type conjugative transfer protein n=1 Tax=uncultured Sphingomonas sp. TaxID=158754 RepID=UPI0025FCB86B|nr:TrbG/VirB9 family P-type conjugative transfer protein [uncultured Sphingomonas sp.]